MIITLASIYESRGIFSMPLYTPSIFLKSKSRQDILVKILETKGGLKKKGLKKMIQYDSKTRLTKKRIKILTNNRKKLLAGLESNLSVNPKLHNNSSDC